MNSRRNLPAQLATVFATLILAFQPAWAEPPDPFVLDGKANIMAEEDFGIVNGKLTIGVNYSRLGSVSGLWAPPFVSSDFLFNTKINGEALITDSYRWRPFCVEETAHIGDVAVACRVSLNYGSRSALVELALTNTGATAQSVEIEWHASGALDKTNTWEFARPESSTPTTCSIIEDALVMSAAENAIGIACNAKDALSDMQNRTLRFTLELAPSETKSAHCAFAVGASSQAAQDCRDVLADPARLTERNESEYRSRVRGVFERLPDFESSNPSLTHFYYRSLVHLLTNRWEVDEFVLKPYYSTGSVKGGCVCNYLWDFGEVWEILPLYDPAAAKEHIKHFLSVDISTHFAFNPITGEALGPWYPVNQEKIIGLAYYYVLNTGDVAFLMEDVAGKPVHEHLYQQALVLDDITKPVALIDYGPSNSHLELRRGIPYNHVMPDLNGRRYMNFVRVARLCEWAGRPEPQLLQRADELKALMKTQLWDSDAKWFHFIDEQGKKDLRYTIQVFKLFSSPVLDAEEETGLLSHLNEKEFLSEFGFHSMAKQDPAYDQVDIDNGGGGSCTAFPPQIIERLYRAGHADKAEDILKRILWWGERLPYWGDSLVANNLDYRRDTPLQCIIDGATVAQAIIFGMFGVSSDVKGNIRVFPQPPSFAQTVKLSHVQLRGHVFDVEVSGNGFTVTIGKNALTSSIGKAVRIDEKTGSLLEVE